MTNPCDITTAVHLANAAGKVSAQQLHQALLVLLKSNFVAVGSTEAWATAVSSGEATAEERPRPSALEGRAAFSA